MVNVIKKILYTTIYILISSPQSFSLDKEIIINKSYNDNIDGYDICYNRSLMTAAKGEGIQYDAIFEHRKSILKNYHKIYTDKPIPKITHHIWLVDKNNPKNIDSKNLKYMKRTFHYVKKSDGWHNIFWTNDESLIQKTIKELAEFNIEVKEINNENIKGYKDIELLYKKSFDYNLAMPSDIASYAILKEYGGIYIDIDYELKQPIDHLIKKYSFIAHEEPIKNLYIGNAFIGASINHPIINKTLELVKRNFTNKAPEYVLKACHDRAFTISGVGPIVLSLAFFKKATTLDGYNDMFMTDNVQLYYPIRNYIKHIDIGIHHGSNTWKKKDEDVMYPYCKKCVKFKNKKL